MKDSGIVRNEKKIRATVHNAGEFARVGREFGSFKKYLQSFGKDEQKLQEDLQERFHHLGPSSARMFLWLAGHPPTPNKEEKAWLAEPTWFSLPVVLNSFGQGRVLCIRKDREGVLK